jgi:pimeloyl-ACP methyl ester carboxylesterase
MDMDAEDGRWTEWEAGPVSRPYMVTGGRTRPRGDRFYALLDVVGRGQAAPDQASLGPEQIRILDLCRVPLTVADLASDVDLPLGVVRILLDDLVQESLIEVRTRAPSTPITDKQLLRQVLDGLHTLLLSVSVLIWHRFGTSQLDSLSVREGVRRMAASTDTGSLATFPGRDGLELVYRSVGEGRPLVLLHGFTSSGLQFLQHGLARTLASGGYRVIAPDLRGHGDSSRPHDPAAYPPDVLADDGLALIDFLQLRDYDLAGYSLGGRIVLRMLARGARPAHAIVGGQGVDALGGPTSRTGGSRRALAAIVSGDRLEPGSPEAMLADWIAQTGADPEALLRVLDTFVETPDTALAEIRVPTLVVAGAQDERLAGELAAALPGARYAQVPGNHFTALLSPELGAAILEFLTD